MPSDFRVGVKIVDPLSELKNTAWRQICLALAIFSQTKMFYGIFSGQTMAEEKEVLAASNVADTSKLLPDDIILLSCLHLEKQLGMRTILLTNDISLGNKAIVHGVKTANCRYIEAFLARADRLR